MWTEVEWKQGLVWYHYYWNGDYHLGYHYQYGVLGYHLSYHLGYHLGYHFHYCARARYFLNFQQVVTTVCYQ